MTNQDTTQPTAAENEQRIIDKFREADERLNNADKNIRKVRIKRVVSGVLSYAQNDWGKTKGHFEDSRKIIAEYLGKFNSNKRLRYIALGVAGAALIGALAINYEHNINNIPSSIEQRVEVKATPKITRIEDNTRGIVIKEPSLDRIVEETKPVNEKPVIEEKKDSSLKTSYTVQRGDSLFKIAKKYDINPVRDKEMMNKFYEVNGKEPLSSKYVNSDGTPKWTKPLSKNPNWITVGMELNISPLIQNNTVHIRKKDTFDTSEKSIEEVTTPKSKALDYNNSNIAYSNSSISQLFPSDYLVEKTAQNKVIFARASSKYITPLNRLQESTHPKKSFDVSYYKDIRVSFVYEGRKVNIENCSNEVSLEKLCITGKFA